MIDPITQLILERDDIGNMEGMFDKYMSKYPGHKFNPCDKIERSLDDLDGQAHKFTGGSEYNINWNHSNIPSKLKQQRKVIKVKIAQCQKVKGKMGELMLHKKWAEFWKTTGMQYCKTKAKDKNKCIRYVKERIQSTLK